MKKLIVRQDLLIENTKRLQARARESGARLMAMLKGNAYGLGLCEAAAVLEGAGVAWFAVSRLGEALALRQSGIAGGIILLSPLFRQQQAAEAIEADVVCTLSSPESANALDAAAKQLGRRAQAHVAVDTGFGRFGFLADDMAAAVRVIGGLTHVDIGGAFSHFSDSFGREEHTRRQFAAFLRAAAVLEDAGIVLHIKHICNSCAFLRFSDMHLDAVRVGSAFLGRLPLPHTYGLHRIGYLESEIMEVKHLPAGHNIGYANTCRTKRPMRIGVIPVGYNDGFGVVKGQDAFRLSDILRDIRNTLRMLVRDNSRYVSVNGKRCRLLGRIGMFNVVADITDTNAKTGDSVIMECNPILIDSAVMREYVTG